MIFRQTARLYAVLTCLLVANVCVATAEASAIGAEPPSQWPASPGLSPQMEGWANAVRFFGADRQQTSLAVALALRGNGDYPFANPDPTSGGAENLATADGWWGLGACPRSVILVAGDVAADAITASALSDPTGRSREPYLRRSAAADPLFDPVGGFERVDTDMAPILVTASARQGLQGVSISALRAVQDMRSGGCSTARQAIIVGGPSAISLEAEVQLLQVGVTEVFRVQGSDRFATAAAVATSLDTAPVPLGVTNCNDARVDDRTARMGFYANSVVEWRPSAQECVLLGRTVVLADGRTGADAMAAGWWTSFWQVPVLLHDGSDRLPDHTVVALQTMEIDNLIILGGAMAISSAVVREAAVLTGAAARRVDGADRYATSVEMAKQFGGWYPTGNASSYDSSIVCIAASSGYGTNSRGWPDALAAGPWCAAASGAAENPRAPRRLLAPLVGRSPREVTQPARPSRDAVPVLLVAAGASRPPAVVEEFLTEVFEPADLWCSSVIAPIGCAMPGFAVAFGGEVAISNTLLGVVSNAVSGGVSSSRPPVTPTIGGMFVTQLELQGYHNSEVESYQFCLPRYGYSDARWFIAGVKGDLRPRSVQDIAIDRWYRQDSDDEARSAGAGSPGCVDIEPGGAESVWLAGVGPEGRVSPKFEVAMGNSSRMSLLSALTAASPELHVGMPTHEDSINGGVTELVFIAHQPMTGVVMTGRAAVVYTGTLSLTLERGYGSTAVDRFNAQWALSTTSGTVTGEAWGEARFDGESWQLSGIASVSGGSWTGTAGVGGFKAQLQANTVISGDDAIEWRIDAHGLK